jgi:hypothetical protein
MGRKKLTDRFKRNLIQVGNTSLCITLPIEHLEALGWKKVTEVHVVLDQENKQMMLTESKEAAS